LTRLTVLTRLTITAFVLTRWVTVVASAVAMLASFSADSVAQADARFAFVGAGTVVALLIARSAVLALLRTGVGGTGARVGGAG
jgi:hypothetical protein